MKISHNHTAKFQAHTCMPAPPLQSVPAMVSTAGCDEAMTDRLKGGVAGYGTLIIGPIGLYATLAVAQK